MAWLGKQDSCGTACDMLGNIMFRKAYLLT